MRKLLPLCLGLITIAAILYFPNHSEKRSENKIPKPLEFGHEEEEKSPEATANAVEERFLYEYYRQVNPLTGKIPLDQKILEFDRAKSAPLKRTSSTKTIETSYISRGPSNFGGRTRTLVIDKNDSNIIWAGGVSGGVFRSTNGGSSWTKISPNNEIHNVTAIVQDTIVGHEGTWYYGTGEALGNSANLSGSPYLGQGIWKTIDDGATWALLPGTTSSPNFDNRFDTVFNLAIDPNTGTLYAAINGRISSFNGTSWDTEVTAPDTDGISTFYTTDIVFASDSRAYAAFSGKCDASVEGVWTRDPSIGTWSKITTPGPDFTPENDSNDDYVNGVGRVVLALAPSNEDKLYILFDNGLVSFCDTDGVDPDTSNPVVEAELWMWDQFNMMFTNYSTKLPNEGGCVPSIDPFSVQGGYDLVVSVKPDDENYVVIGGTNAYKIQNIITDDTFTRIGGYSLANDNSKYLNHHPDIHAMIFDSNDTSILFTGSDGGVHETTNVDANPVSWTSLNNNYQTLQYYHIGIDPMIGSDIVIGGAQDNGTTVGGMDAGLLDKTTQIYYAGGDGGSVAISRDGTCLPFFVSTQNGKLYRAYNAGGSCPSYDVITPYKIVAIDTIYYPSQFVTLFHLDPDNNTAMYYASKNKLLRTTDATNVASDTWEDLGDTTLAFGDSDNFQTFATSPGPYTSSSYLLMGGDQGHIYRLDDPQNLTRNLNDAVDITPPTASSGVFPSIVSGLAIHPKDDNIILATYSNYGTNSIFLSEDKGASWTLVENILSAHSIRSAAIVEDKNETTYFVGTAKGLYSSPDPKTVNWVRESSDQIGYALVSDLKYKPKDQILLIGTHGNGMFETNINSTLSIKDFNSVSSTLRLYPNPVHDNLNISLPQANGLKISYSVVNLSGQKLFSGELDKEQIDVSQLANGMYFLQVITSDGRKGAKSFIKN